MITTIIASFLFFAFVFWMLSSSNRPMRVRMETGDFLEMVAVEGPCKIEWYFTKKGVYHYSTEIDKIRWIAEYKDPLEFPPNCEVIQTKKP